HDAALRVPLLRTFLVKVGGLRASPGNAEKVLGLGAPLLVYPGGELDCLKSFWRRHTVDFHGRTGFIEMALRLGVPILPVVNVGGHEVYFTVVSSQRLARWTGLSRLTRVKTVPLTLGLPWGIWLTGFMPYLPPAVEVRLPRRHAHRARTRPGRCSRPAGSAHSLCENHGGDAGHAGRARRTAPSSRHRIGGDGEGHPRISRSRTAIAKPKRP